MAAARARFGRVAVPAGLAAGGLLAAHTVREDVDRAEAAGGRGRTTAWALAAAGHVAIPPLEEGLRGGDLRDLTQWRRAYNTEVRAHVERAWAAVDPGLEYGRPATWPDPLTMGWKQRIGYTVRRHAPSRRPLHSPSRPAMHAPLRLCACRSCPHLGGMHALFCELVGSALMVVR